MVNVRNLDAQVWRQFGLAAKGRAVPVGRLLTAVLQDWLRASAPVVSRQERAARAAGRWAWPEPERQLVDELLADRRAEAAAEDAE